MQINPINPKDDFFGAALNCAVRYCLGRSSYMPGLVMDEISPMLPHLSPKALWCFERDIQEWLHNGGHSHPYSHEWGEFLSAVRDARATQEGEQTERDVREGGGLLLFSSRRKLAELFEKWASENNVQKSPEGVLAYLTSAGLLDTEKAKRFLMENCQDDE